MAQTTASADISDDESLLIAIHRCLIAGSRSPIKDSILPDSSRERPIRSTGCPASEEISASVTKAIIRSLEFLCQDARFSRASPCRGDPGLMEANRSTHQRSSFPTFAGSIAPNRALSILIQASASKSLSSRFLDSSRIFSLSSNAFSVFPSDNNVWKRSESGGFLSLGIECLLIQYSRPLVTLNHFFVPFTNAFLPLDESSEMLVKCFLGILQLRFQ